MCVARRFDIKRAGVMGTKWETSQKYLENNGVIKLQETIRIGNNNHDLIFDNIFL